MFVAARLTTAAYLPRVGILGWLLDVWESDNFCNLALGLIKSRRV